MPFDVLDHALPLSWNMIVQRVFESKDQNTRIFPPDGHKLADQMDNAHDHPADTKKQQHARRKNDTWCVSSVENQVADGWQASHTQQSGSIGGESPAKRQWS